MRSQWSLTSIYETWFRNSLEELGSGTRPMGVPELVRNWVGTTAELERNYQKGHAELAKKNRNQFRNQFRTSSRTRMGLLPKLVVEPNIHQCSGAKYTPNIHQCWSRILWVIKKIVPELIRNWFRNCCGTGSGTIAEPVPLEFQNS